MECETPQYGMDVFTLMANNAICQQHVALKNKISEISLLEDNWDGYGAVAMPESTVKNAFKFVDSFLAEKYPAKISIDATPTAYGTIVLDFESNEDIVSVEIGDKQVGFFTDFKKANFYSDGEDTDFRVLPDDIKRALDILAEEHEESCI